MVIKSIESAVKGAVFGRICALTLAFNPVKGELFKAGLFNSKGDCKDDVLEDYSKCIKGGLDLPTNCDDDATKDYNFCIRPDNDPKCRVKIETAIANATKNLTDCGAKLSLFFDKDGEDRLVSINFNITGIDSETGALVTDDTGATTWKQVQCGNETYRVPYGSARDIESVQEKINEICDGLGSEFSSLDKIFLVVAGCVSVFFLGYMCRLYKKMIK